MAKKKKAPATKVITVRVTENEFNAVIKSAAEAGMNRSEYSRLCLLGENIESRRRMSRVVSIDQKLASQILSKLGTVRYASNLNQIAKAINQGVTMFSAETETALLEACLFIAEIRNLLMQAMHKRPRSGQ